MKHLFWLIGLFIYGMATAQPLPHGMVYGKKPGTIGIQPAQRLEAFMARRTRINVAISGTVLKVTKAKGGWFNVDAGKGKIIAAHFKNYNVTLPLALKGRHVIIEGVAQKQLMPLEKKRHNAKASAPKPVTLEVSGLMID